MSFRYRHRPGLLAATVLAAVVSLAAPSLTARADAPSGVRPDARTEAVRTEAVQTEAVRAAASGVEDDGAGCPVPGTVPSTNDATLPDPFRRVDGTRISSTSDWRCRRAEIKELAERSVYGKKPAKPAGVTGTVSASTLTVNVTDQGKSASFSAKVELPSGTGPFPAVVVIGGLGADTATIKASGAAVINFDPYTVGREGTARNNKQGAFHSVYGSSSGTGLLMAWSWG
ncbi:hypothetical protein [Streptomyces sp. NTK 937]|uniref:glucuronyl esterase domain-containing protein n=1 Tax=Streptomyces sp. NTK 937 TaxID=1487711 RepID=UPI0007C7DAA6|nr:hypothetical protein [Streptomyces sp. NTK 937]